jgi:hypothetical protein
MINKFVGKPHIQAEIAIKWITPFDTRVDEVFS